MLQYEVLERSLIGNQVFEPGAIVPYDGYPSANLKPTCAEGEAKAAELVQINADRVKQMQLDNPASPVMDVEGFAKAIASAIAEANAEQADKLAALTDAVAAMNKVAK